MGKSTLTKDTVPAEYTVGLALFDAVPVILFLAACVLLWKMTGSVLVLAGGIVSFVSGMGKVLWKILVAVQKKNVWPLFVQMRFWMPAGLTLVLAGFLITCFTKDLSSFWEKALTALPILFFVLSLSGMTGMILCGAKLDPVKARSNWIEQGCNTIAQGAFFAAMALIFFR
ncbi:MAG: hypothetical protein II510_07560 [Erysipelotrichales bacterium]|nr:hypothetical protein [Erysipelotrichales bacterium]